MAAASDKAWSQFSQADYSISQWRDACLIDRGVGDPTSKERYALPVKEPSGALNRNAVHAAAARINQADAPAEKISAAARALVRLYGELGEDPPEHLRQIAHRSVDTGDVELRNTPGRVELRGGNGRQIGGYAALFDTTSRNMGPYVERISPSFFNKSCADGWPGAGGSGVICRFDHSNDKLLGTTKSGTLRLQLDNVGLDYVVDVPETRQDVLELVARKDVSQSSFAFICIQESWDHASDGTPIRILVEGKTIDVSPVVTPAYEATSVGLRSLAAFKNIPEADVLELAARRELRKLMIRTDIDRGAPVKTRSGAEALAYIQGRRWPEQPRRPMSAAMALMYIQGKRWPDDPVVGRSLSSATRDPRIALLRLRKHRYDQGW